MLVSFIFLSSLAIVGKACSNASFILCEILLTLSESSERVVMMTSIISLKYATQIGQRNDSPFLATQMEKNLVNISSHQSDCTVISGDRFCRMSMRMVSTSIWAFYDFNLLDRPPPSAKIYRNTCRNFFKHSSAFVLRFLESLSSNQKTCRKKSGRSKESQKWGIYYMVISQSSKNYLKVDPPVCIFSARVSMNPLRSKGNWSNTASFIIVFSDWFRNAAACRTCPESSLTNSDTA